MSEILLVLFTAALVAVTGWYAHLTRRIAQSSEASSKAATQAAESAARSAAASEAALLAESMPFVRPAFGGGGRGANKVDYAMHVTNSGRHAAVNVELYLGDDLLHTFPVIEPGESGSKRWRNDETAERLWEARNGGWVLRTRYSDPYGNRYEVEVQRRVAGGVTPETTVSTYRVMSNGSRTLLAGREAST